jgi:hypothetical protein
MSRCWPKTSGDFVLGETRFPGISEGPIRLAAVDPFRPGRIQNTSSSALR